MDEFGIHSHPHTHEFYSTARLDSHLDREHGGGVSAVVGLKEEHDHDSGKRKVNWNYAARINFEKRAVRLWPAAKVVFFGIEGCLKEDSILDAIMKSGAKATACSVPAVGMWDCPELEPFVRKFLLGKTVVIVPDADWKKVRYNRDGTVKRNLVEHQARVFQGRLLNLGVPVVHIAAPPCKGSKPLERWNEFKGKEDACKGVDDWLGFGGGTLDELVCIDREPVGGIEEWLTGTLEGRQSRVVTRLAGVVRQLSLIAGDDGKIEMAYATIAKVMGVKVGQVGRDLETLADAGAVEVRGATKIARGMFGLDWVTRPTITIHPDLRSLSLPERPLGEVVDTAR